MLPIYALSARPLETDEEGRVVEELRCLHCGYLLKMSQRSATCPECAIPVGRSRYGAAIRLSDPKWVLAVHKGARTLLVGFAGMAGAVLVVTILRLTMGLPARASSVLVGLFVSVVAKGLAQVTIRDRLLRERFLSLRRIARLSEWIVGGVSAALFLYLWHSRSITIVMLLALFLILGISGCIVLLLLYLRRIAFRVPDASLARHFLIIATAFLAYALLFAGIASIVFRLALQSAPAAITPAPPLPPLLQAALIISIQFPLALFSGWIAVTLWRLRRDLLPVLEIHSLA